MRAGSALLCTAAGLANIEQPSPVMNRHHLDLVFSNPRRIEVRMLFPRLGNEPIHRDRAHAILANGIVV